MKLEKVNNIVANLHNRNEYVIHIRNLKQALMHRIIKFNQKTWLKSYIEMNIELGKKSKKCF